MTPLHLEMLMHYYTRADDFDGVDSNETIKEYAYHLAHMGWLYTPANDQKHFNLTEYGDTIVQKLMGEFEKLSLAQTDTKAYTK